MCECRCKKTEPGWYRAYSLRTARDNERVLVPVKGSDGCAIWARTESEVHDLVGPYIPYVVLPFYEREDAV